MGKPKKDSESKKDKGKNGSSSGHTTSSSNEEEKAQMKKKEIAKGKKPVEVEMEDEIMSDVEFITRKAKGIVIAEAQAPQAHTADDKSKAVVMSTYDLRSGKKGRGVNIASENKQTDSEPKGRGKKRGRGLRSLVSLTSGLNELEFAQDADLILMKRQKKGKGKKEEETDVVQGSETDPEEACRRINKGRNPGNDSDEDGAGGGAGAGAGTGADRAITA